MFNYTPGIYQPTTQGLSEDVLGLVYRGNNVIGIYIIDDGDYTYYRFDTRHPITTFLPTLNLPTKVKDRSIKYERKWLSNTKLDLLQDYLNQGYRTDWVLIDLLILRLITEVGTLNGLTYKEVSQLFRVVTDLELVLYYMSNFDFFNDLLTKVYRAVSTYDTTTRYTGYTGEDSQTLLTLDEEYGNIVYSLMRLGSSEGLITGHKLVYILAASLQGIPLDSINSQEDIVIREYFSGGLI